MRLPADGSAGPPTGPAGRSERAPGRGARTAPARPAGHGASVCKHSRAPFVSKSTHRAVVDSGSELCSRRIHQHSLPRDSTARAFAATGHSQQLEPRASCMPRRRRSGGHTTAYKEAMKHLHKSCPETHDQLSRQRQTMVQDRGCERSPVCLPRVDYDFALYSSHVESLKICSALSGVTC